MLTQEQLQQFETDGFLVLPGFLSEDEVRSLESARARLVREMVPSEHQISIFSTLNDRQVRMRGIYGTVHRDRYCCY